MADKEAKSMRKIMANDQAYYYSGITSIMVNGKNAYDLKGKFLSDLHKNALSGTNGEDADKLIVVVFPISLVGDAWRWFDRIKGSITSWVDLTDNFFRKYYLPSRTGNVNSLIIKWDPTNPKFENWLASKFVNYKTMDIFTKGALWDYWKLGSDEIEPTNDEASDLEETDYDDEQEISEIFRIETNLFDYETPLYTKNHGLTLEYGLNPLQLCIVDSELKEEALRNKAIMEGLINEDDESCNNGWKRWDSYEIADHDQEEREYEIGKCLHLPKTTKETRSNTPYPEEGNTPYSSYMEIKYSGRYQTWSLLQETPDMSYPRHWIRRINNIPDPINRKLKNKF
ncbi:hypothetical protein Tco_1532879 [Tanacetum coccineum]